MKYDDIDNNFVTTLNGPITSSSTVIDLNAVPTHTTKGYLTIDADDSALAEHIYFESKGAGFVTCPATGGRGQGGTSAQAHDDGAVVKMYFLREHLTPLITDIATNASDITTLQGSTGDWKAPTTVIPTRASADDPTYGLQFNAVDLTSKVSVGQKITWKQNSTTRYGFVTAISFSTNTTLTLYGGTDYDVDDTATYPISDVKFSSMKAPYGFPLSPDKWSIVYTHSGTSSQANPTGGVYYNLGGSISVPIGEWNIRAQGTGGLDSNSATDCLITVALSTTNNSASDDSDIVSHRDNSSLNSMSPYAIKKIVGVSSKTLYYINIKSYSTITGTLLIRADTNYGYSTIAITIAYL